MRIIDLKPIETAFGLCIICVPRDDCFNYSSQNRNIEQYFKFCSIYVNYFFNRFFEIQNSGIEILEDKKWKQMKKNYGNVIHAN
jgi:hypothetical protein